MKRITIHKEALPRAEKLLEAIKSLAGEKGIISVPLKTLYQVAGFKENQKTSARSALDVLVKVGAIKVEWIFDPAEMAKGKRVRNLPDDRVDELVNLNVIQAPNEGLNTGPENIQTFSPVITILKTSLSNLTVSLSD